MAYLFQPFDVIEVERGADWRHHDTIQDGSDARFAQMAVDTGFVNGEWSRYRITRVGFGTVYGPTPERPKSGTLADILPPPPCQ